MAEAQTRLGSVSLPAGSYDAEKLGKGLAAAAGAKAADQPAKVNEAVVGALAGTNSEQRDPALLPDHVYVDVDNGHGGTERQQVYSPELAGAHQAAETGNTGTVVETDDDAEKARREAIAQAVKASAPKKGDTEPDVAVESRTGAADPVAAETDTAPAAAAPAVAAEAKK